MGRTLMWIVGGVLVATGVLSLFFSFGAPFGNISTHLSEAGFDAVADFGFLGGFPVAIFGLGLGIPTLIVLNATAWKETDGY